MLFHVQDCRGEESKKDNVASKEKSRGQQLTEQLEKYIGGRLLLGIRTELSYMIASVCQAMEMIMFSLFRGGILVESTSAHQSKSAQQTAGNTSLHNSSGSCYSLSRRSLLMHVTGLDSRNSSFQASLCLPSPERRAFLPAIFKRWLFLQVALSPASQGVLVYLDSLAYNSHQLW